MGWTKSIIYFSEIYEYWVKLAASLEENLRSRTCDAFDGQVTDEIVGWKVTSPQKIKK